MVCKASLTHVSHTCLPECPAPGGQSPLPPSYHLSQVLCRGLWKPSATMLQYSTRVPCVCVCLHVCVCAYVCIALHVYVHMCSHACVWTCVSLCVCMPACKHVPNLLAVLPVDLSC